MSRFAGWLSYCSMGAPYGSWIVAEVRLPIVLAVLFAVVGSPDAKAIQVNEEGSPEYQAMVSLEALRRGDFHTFAVSVDRESMIEFRELWLPFMRTLEDSRADTAATRALSGGQDVADLETISPESFLMTFLNAAGYGPISPVGPASEVRILGRVMEGDSLAHVVYSMAAIPHERYEPRVQVITLRQSVDTWRILLGQGLSTTGSIHQR